MLSWGQEVRAVELRVLNYFLAIAREEGTHLTALEDRLMALIP